MSDQRPDPELEALERQVQAAFRSTLPRAGFERELWARIQPRRRWRERWDGLSAGLGSRQVLAGLGGVAVVALFAGFIFMLAAVAHPRGAGSSATPALGPGAGQPQPQPQSGAGSEVARAAAPRYEIVLASPAAGPATALPADAPLYRYTLPDRSTADGFAAGLGARPVAASTADAGTLGNYDAAGFTLNVSSGANGGEPRYRLQVKGAGEGGSGSDVEVADAYLARLGLVPEWRHSRTSSTGPPGTTTVRYNRLFDMSGLSSDGPEVDALGQPLGMVVQMVGGRVVVVDGPVPMRLEGSSSHLQAVAGAAAASSQRGAPRLRVTEVRFVYMPHSAGGKGYYVPAYMLVGSTDDGRPASVVVPAVDLQSLPR